MRAIVCLQREGISERVLWMSESRSGVYVGIFGSAVDSHTSYHQDGTRHFRVAKSHHQRWKDAPLGSHTGLKQLMHGAIPTIDKSIRLPRDAVTTRDQAIVVDESELGGYDSLAIDVWLADLKNLELMQRHGSTVHLDHGFKFLSFTDWKLESFRDLHWGISLWAAKTLVSSVEA